MGGWQRGKGFKHFLKYLNFYQSYKALLFLGSQAMKWTEPHDAFFNLGNTKKALWKEVKFGKALIVTLEDRVTQSFV